MKENNQTTADMSGLVDIRDVKVDRSLPLRIESDPMLSRSRIPIAFVWGM